MKGMILDIDGVLRRGDQPIEGSLEAVDSILESGLKLMLLSNNSTRTREGLSVSISDMGFPYLECVNSAYAAAVYVSEGMKAKTSLALGEEGLIQELNDKGLQVTKAGEGLTLDEIAEDRSEYDALVVGMDRDLRYKAISHALNALRSGSFFVATNTDPTFPMEKGRVLPGAGSAVAPVKYCSGVDPKVIGKPEPYSTKIALNIMGLEPAEVLVVGDRPDTDILAGMRAGCPVARVLTGDVGPREGEDYPVKESLFELMEYLGFL